LGVFVLRSIWRCLATSFPLFSMHFPSFPASLSLPPSPFHCQCLGTTCHPPLLLFLVSSIVSAWFVVLCVSVFHATPSPNSSRSSRSPLYTHSFLKEKPKQQLHIRLTRQQIVITISVVVRNCQQSVTCGCVLWSCWCSCLRLAGQLPCSLPFHFCFPMILSNGP
jgi:hypothetical protein